MDSQNKEIQAPEIQPEISVPEKEGIYKRGMGMAGFAVRYPVTVSMIIFGLIMLGWISLNRLPTNLFPDLRAPRITVIADAPGLAPQEMERVVVEPLEGRLSTIKGVERVSSVSRADSGAIIIDFNWDTDMDFAMLEVKKNVQGSFIEEIETITTLRYDPNALPIMTLGLFGKRGLDEMLYLAERTIGPALERIKGVARAQVIGGLMPEIQCRLNPELLHFYNLTIEEVSQALERGNVNATGGWADEGNQRYVIRAIGELKDINQVSQIVVGYSSGTPIYLTDLGEIKWDFEERTNAVWMDGQPAVGIALYQESGSNTVEVVREVRKFLQKDVETGQPGGPKPGEGGGGPGGGGRGGPGGWGGMPEAEPSIIPADTQIEIAYDQSQFISRAIDEVKDAAVEGVVLASLVLWIFLKNIRTTLIVALSIPISIIATFNVMYFTNLSLNIMTLGGLALGSGMLVDNAIVIIENIFRRLQMGDSQMMASMNGAGEVSSAIVASTLTSVVVFVPIAYMGDVTAQLFQEQALTVVYSQIVSLLIALIMIPSLCSRFLNEKAMPEPAGETPYSRFLKFALRHRFLSLVVVALITAGTVPMAKSIKQEFVPQAAESQFILKLRMPAGTRLETTEAAARNVEGWLMNDLGENIEHVFTRIGQKPDDTGAIEEDPEGPNTAEILVSLKKDAPMKIPSIITYLEPRYRQISGLEVNYHTSQSSLSSLMGENRSAIVVEVRGRSLETLGTLAREVKNRMDTLPEVSNVRTTILEGNPEVHLIPDRTALSEAGLDQQRLVALLQSQLRGTVATSLQDVEQTKDIRVQLGDGKMNLPELMETLIPIGTNRAVTLSNLVEMKVEPGPREILHREQERVARVMADMAEGQKLSDAVDSVRANILSMEMPDNYAIRLGGEEERRMESFQRLRFALILSLILVYMVMASLFESLMHPLIIMFSMPLGAIGVVWAFVLTGQTLNLMGYIGIIMLGGIVVNNAIVLIDYINFLRRDEGLEMYDAIVNGGRRRLRPIWMTTLTSVLGLVPMALGLGEGAEIRTSMAVAVIGGLMSSTVLTLVIIPILYSMAEEALDAVKRFFIYGFSRQPRLEESETV